jgi:hypothetical protein
MAAMVNSLFTSARADGAFKDKESGSEAAAPAAAVRFKNSRRFDFIVVSKNK